MNLNKHRDKMTEDTRRLIQFELDQFGLAGPYILFAGEPDVHLPECTFGATSPRMALSHRDQIPDYQGNGPTWVVNMPAILKVRQGRDAVAVFAATCAHELAHRLELPGLVKYAPPAMVELLGPEIREAFGQANPLNIPPAEDVRIDKGQHPPSFIRLAIHVRHRLQPMGWRIWIDELLNWQKYAFASPGQHLDALRSELSELEDLPLSSILRIPEPPAFADLFETSPNTVAKLVMV